MRPTIFVSTLNEEAHIGRCLESIKSAISEDTSHETRLIVVDSNSTDKTVSIAEAAGVEIWTAPRGKLSAMDAAIRHFRPEVVINADGDKVYMSSWLREILRPIEEEGAVMASGICDVLEQNSWTYWLSAYYSLAAQIVGINWGGNNAFLTDAYIACGGYDTKVNQKDFMSVWRAEEMEFPKRMSRFGPVILNPKAKALTSARRWDPFVSDPGFILKRNSDITF